MNLTELLAALNRKASKPKGICAINFVREGLTFSVVEWDNQKKPTIKACDFVQTTFDSLEVLRALSSLVKKYNCNGYHCNWVLQPKDYSLISLPNLPVSSDELSTALKFHIKDQIDFPVSEAIVDYFKVPYLSKSQNEELIYVVVSRKAYLDLVAKIIVESGLHLNVIEIPEFSLRNVVELFADRGQGVGIIDTNGGSTRLIIMREGFVYLVRKIEVELNKTQTGDEFHVFLTEIQRSCDYYENGLGQTPVSKFFLLSSDTSLGTKMNESLGVPVETLTVASKLTPPEGATSERMQQCVYAIGGALRQDEDGK